LALNPKNEVMKLLTDI